MCDQSHLMDTMARNVKKYRLKSQKDRIPYTWTILFTNLNSKGVYIGKTSFPAQRCHDKN